MNRPADWPHPGPIDLDVHDRPHGSAVTEWWYVNSHMNTAAGDDLSLFAAFFRIALGKDDSGCMQYAHAVTWAVSDAKNGVYRGESRLDHAAPRIGLERLAKGEGSRDPRLNRALAEVLERGKLPAPDRFFDGDVKVSTERLDLDFAGARFAKRADGSYGLSLTSEGGDTACNLIFKPVKPVTRHGDGGVVHGHTGEAMFYYFIPRCELSGDVTVNGRTQPVAEGTGWYDHEFGGDVTAAMPEPSQDIAWNWTAIQLSNGWEVSAYSIFGNDQNDLKYQCAVVIDQAGNSRTFHDFRFESDTTWRSLRTFHDYPTAWRLVIPEAELDLTIKATFPDQEFVTLISDPAFWEGRCDVSGAAGGARVRGKAYIERSGFELVKDLDGFFGAVGEVVRESVERVLPLNPTASEARDLIASAERAHYMDGVDVDQLGRALIQPIREITDRGGKSWRSYAALACCDVVGGDSRKYAQWLAMPELLHVGSLIVDDVQDRSEIRRGGPACHLVHGEPKAINSGTAAYFLTQRLLFDDSMADGVKLKLYDLYFDAMRAGHAGQALDLDGMGDTIADVVRSGDAKLLEERVLAVHRLKTAAPAGSLARMGALVGGGSAAQVEGVGRYFEALGMAFQLIDDVLNLRGFKGDLKSAGEDIANGTITVPVAKAMARMAAEDRVWLQQTLAAKPRGDLKLIRAVIDKLEDCGALSACVDDARQRVEDAWSAIEPQLDDSMPKVMLRAFGWYVIDRHY